MSSLPSVLEDSAMRLVAGIIAILCYPRGEADARLIYRKMLERILEPLLSKKRLREILAFLVSQRIVILTSETMITLPVQIYRDYFAGQNGLARQTLWYILTSLGWDDEILKEIMSDIQDNETRRRLFGIWVSRKEVIRSIVQHFGLNEAGLNQGIRAGAEICREGNCPPYPTFQRELKTA